MLDIRQEEIHTHNSMLDVFSVDLCYRCWCLLYFVDWKHGLCFRLHRPKQTVPEKYDWALEYYEP